MNTSVTALASGHLAWLSLRRSPSTTEFYKYAYQRLGEYVITTPTAARLDKWTTTTADQYAVWLAGKDLKPVSVRHYLNAVVTLCRWCRGETLLKRNPLDGYIPPAGKPEPVHGYRPEHIQAMLKSCKGTGKGRRNTAIILFLLDSGVRASECCALTVGDVDLVRGTAIIRHGKGDKSRVTTFSQATASAVRRYLIGDHLDGQNNAAPLFPGQGTQPMSRFGLSRLIRKLAEAAGMGQQRLGSHRLRHSCAEQTLVNGGNTRFLQVKLGHSDIKQLERYSSGLTVDDLRKQQEQTSPLQALRGIR